MGDGPRRIWRILLLAICSLLGWYVLGVLWALLVLVVAGFEKIDPTRPTEFLHEILDWTWFQELANPFEISGEQIVLVWLPTGLVVMTQFAMLLPAARPLRSDGRPRRPWFAGVAGGVLALILTGGLLLALADLPRIPVGLGLAGDSKLASERVEHIIESWMPLFGFGLLFASWIFWTVVLLVSLRRSPSGWLASTVRWLLVGSLIELAIALPIYVIVRRRFSCWCSLPSFWAVMSSLAVVLALTGPGVILLWRRRAGLPTDAWSDRCLVCGYGRAPEAGARCPECGTRWGRTMRPHA